MFGPWLIIKGIAQGTPIWVAIITAAVIVTDTGMNTSGQQNQVVAIVYAARREDKAPVTPYSLHTLLYNMMPLITRTGAKQGHQELLIMVKL